MKKLLSKYFAVCVKNVGYEVSLETRKVYPVLDDKKADELGLLRVIDESGESYLYPENCFVPVKLPQVALRAFARAA